MKKNKILIVGHKGRMGSVVFDKLKNLGYEVVGVDKNDRLDTQANVNLVVDFSVPEMSVVLAEWCLNNKIPLIVGTTGHNEKQLQCLKTLSEKVAVLKAGNFSIGMHALKQCSKTVINKKPNEIVIYEKHHRFKKDSPSGTAVELKVMIENLWKDKVLVLAERGGKEVGEHLINFYFENEVLSISHKAYSRECFADGVGMAVSFMLENKANGMFEFDDIIM